VPLSFEEVFVKSENVNYWINISPHRNKKIIDSQSKLQQNESLQFWSIVYDKQQRKDGANDYFESGVVRCDLVLRDYFKIFHPEDVTFKSEPLIYMKALK
jgi:iron complex transport system substrate-binding protein